VPLCASCIYSGPKTADCAIFLKIVTFQVLVPLNSLTLVRFFSELTSDKNLAVALRTLSSTTSIGERNGNPMREDDATRRDCGRLGPAYRTLLNQIVDPPVRSDVPWRKSPEFLHILSSLQLQIGSDSDSSKLQTRSSISRIL
jgi:hypothetical protein